MPTGEKKPAQWELYTGNEKDARDFRRLESEMLRIEDLDFTDSKAFAGNALILRRGDRPLGYAIWSFVHDKKDSTKAMLVERLFVSKNARSAGTSLKFMQALTAEAEKAGAQKLMWFPKTFKMLALSKKIGADRRYLIMRELPIGKLNPETLFGSEATEQNITKKYKKHE